MLHYLVPDEVAAGSLEPNLDFYEPRTAHGSTLSPGVHAALLARAGRPEAGLEMLRLTARIDLDDIGHTTAGGLHLAAMGSVWRALASASPACDPSATRSRSTPCSRPDGTTLELRVRFRGSRVRVRVQPRIRSRRAPTRRSAPEPRRRKRRADPRRAGIRALPEDAGEGRVALRPAAGLQRNPRTPAQHHHRRLLTRRDQRQRLQAARW